MSAQPRSSASAEGDSGGNAGEWLRLTHLILRNKDPDRKIRVFCWALADWGSRADTVYNDESMSTVLEQSSRSPLWSLVLERPQIDASELAAAIEHEIQGPLDFRTRLLIRDAARALAGTWGWRQHMNWIRNSPVGDRIQSIDRENLGPLGFPSLADRVMESTRSETVLQYLREMGSRLPLPATIAIGGSISLILSGRLSRRTEDIDVVDEVPAELRVQHDLLENLSRRYGLKITHFQSHYLPTGWESRMSSLGVLGKLDVRVVDSVDVWLSKLFSIREKDRDDLRALLPRLDKTSLTDRLRATCHALLAESRLRDNAAENWYILFGEDLPA